MFTVCVGRECAPLVITILCLQSEDIACCRFVYGFGDRVRCYCDRLKGKLWSLSEKHTEPSSNWVQAGGNGEVLLSHGREERNYDISIVLFRQELNICSEASCNIIQVRGDSAVMCYLCVPSGSEEERQTSCSYHNFILLILLHTQCKQCSLTQHFLYYFRQLLLL